MRTSASHSAALTEASPWEPLFVSTVTLHDGDADSDGLPDDYETAHGLNPALPSDALLDGDGDGHTNHDEFIMGTDPQDRNSRLTVTVTRVGSDIQVAFPTVAGRIYAVEYTNSLSLPMTSLQSGIPGTGSPVIVPDTNAASLPRRFYHVTVQAPAP